MYFNYNVNHNSNDNGNFYVAWNIRNNRLFFLSILLIVHSINMSTVHICHMIKALMYFWPCIYVLVHSLLSLDLSDLSGEFFFTIESIELKPKPFIFDVHIRFSNIKWKLALTNTYMDAIGNIVLNFCNIAWMLQFRFNNRLVFFY